MMAPIKLKLSLSRASLNPPSDVTVGKGKGKESNGVAEQRSPTLPTIRIKPMGSNAVEANSPSVFHQPNGENEAGAIAGPSDPLSPSFQPITSPSARKKPGPKLGSKNKPRASAMTPVKGTTKSKSSKPKAVLKAVNGARASLPPHLRSQPSTPSASASSPASPGTMLPPPLPTDSRLESPSPFAATPNADTPNGYSEQTFGIAVKAEPTEYDYANLNGEGGSEREDSADPLNVLDTPLDISDHNTLFGDSQDMSQFRGKPATKYGRNRKPLKELLQKIMQELRRKDEYALFGEPVNPDDFPGYLEIIGGEDKMMDLSTMQSKVDNNEYRSIEHIEGDLRLLSDAAQAFNPPKTIPHRSAKNMLAHGLRHIERSKALVMTPSPSPSPTRPTDSETGTPWRGMSTPGREMTGIEDHQTVEIPPLSYIPTEMLDFPPNSLSALAVGWHLNGGKRTYVKREIRTREKFSGKWRHWDLDGTRALDEMENVEEVFSGWKGKPSRTITDWRAMRKDGEWWDWPGFGGPTGQPPIPFTRYPVRPRKMTRELGTSEWGVYPEVGAEVTVLESKAGYDPSTWSEREYEIISDHVRPVKLEAKDSVPKAKEGAATTGQVYEPGPLVPSANGEWFRDVLDGDVRGEAYERSVKAFLDGAERMSASSGIGELDAVRHHVTTQYHHQALDSDAKRILRSTLSSLQQPTQSNFDYGRDSYARASLRWVTRTSNQLDITTFITDPSEFNFIGENSGIANGLDVCGQKLGRFVESRDQASERDKVVGVKRKSPSVDPNAIGASGAIGNGGNMAIREPEASEEDEGRAKKAAKGDHGLVRAGSSPLSTAPPSPRPESVPVNTAPADRAALGTASTNAPPGVTPEEFTRLRLDMLSSCKFYPLAYLKKMDAKTAERLLPPGVRGLLTREGQTASA